MTRYPLSNDAYGGAPLGSPRPARRVPILTATVMLAGLGVLAGYGYERLTLSDDSAAHQVSPVRAGDAPTKIRLTWPEGMTIPSQDKHLYEALDEKAGDEALDGEAGDNKLERRLPPPEEPLPPPSEPAASAFATQPAATAPVQEREPVEPAALKPAAENAQIVAVAPTKAPKAPPPPAASYVVQLAAFRSEVNVATTWTQLLKAHRDLLGGLRPKVQRADLGIDKGVFFRLRVGPLAGEAEARKLCTKLKARKLGCFVVKP